MFVLDTTVFILTVIRTMQMRHTMQTQAILVILFRDGESRLQLYPYESLTQAYRLGTLYYLYAFYTPQSNRVAHLGCRVLVAALGVNIVTFIVSIQLRSPLDAV